MSICASEEQENFRLIKKSNRSLESIGVGLVTYIVYTIIPKIEALDNNFGKSIVTVTGAALTIYGASKLYNIVCDIHGQSTPSEEKKERINEARQKNVIFAAKGEFKRCLMKNTKSERNDSGIPKECEAAGAMFATIAGKPEFDKIKILFNDLYRN